MDNALASLKAYHDGIADALGVNDCRFGIVPQAWGDSEKGGKVVIRLEWEAAQ
jgi:hypothetical protein